MLSVDSMEYGPHFVSVCVCVIMITFWAKTIFSGQTMHQCGGSVPFRKMFNEPELEGSRERGRATARK